MKSLCWALCLLLGFVVFAGCAPKAKARVAGSEERTRTTTPDAPAKDATDVTVGLTEFKITLTPATAPVGTVAFHVTNNGKIVHAFAIKGQGVDKSTAVLKPGETATLQVDQMTAGTYTVLCPVDDHAKAGMRTTFTIQ